MAALDGRDSMSRTNYLSEFRGDKQIVTGTNPSAFLQTTLERAGAGEPLTRKWRFTVHYVLSTPDTEDEVLANPAGLNITHFERVADLS